jgi:protein TonB
MKEIENMSAVLIYKSRGRWEVLAAFTGAVLLHAGAVALAERGEPSVPASADVPFVDVFADDPGEEQPPPAPEESVPDLPVPPEITDPLFIDESPTPPPARKKMEAVPQRLVRASSPGTRAATMGAAKILALSAPRPEYPYEARRQRATGSGVAVLTIDPGTGNVTEVRMSRSTGNAVLDQATISAFRRWRFKPGTVSTVQTPITFTLTGAAY